VYVTGFDSEHSFSLITTVTTRWKVLSERVKTPRESLSPHLPHLLNSWNSSSSSECRNSNHFVSVNIWFSVSGTIVRRSI